MGYRVSRKSIEGYRVLKDLPQSNKWSILQDLELKIGFPLALVRVEREDNGGAASDYYFCCLADDSGRPYDCGELLAVPVPPAFHQLPQLVPVEGDLHRLFAPRAMIFTIRRARSE